MRVLLFLLLLAGAAFSALCVEGATEIILTEQGTNIVVVIGLTIVVIAIAYMVGQAMGNAGYIIFAKDELFHLMFSIMLLIGFGGIVVFSCAFFDFFYVSFFEESGMFGEAGLESSCYAPGKSMKNTASCYATIAANDARDLSESYIQEYIGNLMDSTFSWTVQIPFVNALSSTAGAYKRVISNQYDIILNSFLVPALMSISMQKIMLDFVSENAIKWILPIGFLLRVFIPTRRMGNIMIALSLGLYILVPFMYVFNFAMYEGVMTDCTDFADAVCDNAMDSQCTPPANTCSNPNSFWNVARLIPLAFFLPNLTLAILITFLGSINKALNVIG